MHQWTSLSRPTSIVVRHEWCVGRCARSACARCPFIFEHPYFHMYSMTAATYRLLYTIANVEGHAYPQAGVLACSAIIKVCGATLCTSAVVYALLIRGVPVAHPYSYVLLLSLCCAGAKPCTAVAGITNLPDSEFTRQRFEQTLGIGYTVQQCCEECWNTNDCVVYRYFPSAGGGCVFYLSSSQVGTATEYCPLGIANSTQLSSSLNPPGDPGYLLGPCNNPSIYP